MQKLAIDTFSAGLLLFISLLSFNCWSYLGLYYLHALMFMCIAVLSAGKWGYELHTFELHTKVSKIDAMIKEMKDFFWVFLIEVYFLFPRIIFLIFNF